MAPPDSEVDTVSEWSKPLLLLRVMFDIPETEVDDKMYAEYGEGAMAYGGFSTVLRQVDPANPDRLAYAEIPDTYCMPLTWAHDKPELVGFLAHYNGPPYAAAREYEFFREHFPFRKNLERCLEDNE